MQHGAHAREVGDDPGRGSRGTARGGDAGPYSEDIVRQRGGQAALSVHGGPIRGRRAPLGPNAQEDQFDDRRHLLDTLRSGQRRGPPRSHSDLETELGKRRKADVTAIAEGPETGGGACTPPTTRSSQAAWRPWSSQEEDAARPTDAGASRIHGGASEEADGSAVLAARPRVEMPTRGKPSSAPYKAYDHAERSSNPHGEVADAQSKIRGQEPLLGTRGAGNQCGGRGCERSSNEDVKMHHSYVHAGRINFTACRSRGAVGAANATAVEVAARLVAWHTAAATEPPAGGG